MTIPMDLLLMTEQNFYGFFISEKTACQQYEQMSHYKVLKRNHSLSVTLHFIFD
jgi:hypothetical protein